VDFSLEDVPLYARMADDGSAKRLKPFEDGVAEVAELLWGRVAELESEIEKLRLETSNVRRVSQRSNLRSNGFVSDAAGRL